MVEHDRRLRKCARQINELAKLGVVHPGVKAEVEWRQPGKALAHLRVQQQAGGADDRRAPGRLVGVRGGDEADAAEAAAAGRNHRLQHLFDGRTQRQIGVVDDAGAGAGRVLPYGPRVGKGRN